MFLLCRLRCEGEGEDEGECKQLRDIPSDSHFRQSHAVRSTIRNRLDCKKCGVPT